MMEVWEPFDYRELREFYHEDVVGHHVARTIRLADIENRLRRDRIYWKDPVYDVKELVVEPDKWPMAV